MNIDKKTGKIALIALVLALIWSLPTIKAPEGVDPMTAVVTVLIRTVIVFALIRFILWIKDKNKK